MTNILKLLQNSELKCIIYFKKITFLIYNHKQFYGKDIFFNIIFTLHFSITESNSILHLITEIL